MVTASEIEELMNRIPAEDELTCSADTIFVSSCRGILTCLFPWPCKWE